MRKGSTNHRNSFLMKKSCLLLTQYTRNHEFAIGGETTNFYGVNATLLIGGIGRERKRKQLLLEDTTTVKNDFYR